MHHSHARPSVRVTRPIRGTVLVIDNDQWSRSIIASALVLEGFLDHVNRVVRQAHPDFRLPPPTREFA